MRAERPEQADIATRKESWFTNTPTTKIGDDYISELDETQGYFNIRREDQASSLFSQIDEDDLPPER